MRHTVSEGKGLKARHLHPSYLDGGTIAGVQDLVVDVSLHNNLLNSEVLGRSRVAKLNRQRAAGSR